jgi:hypothetical protein
MGLLDPRLVKSVGASGGLELRLGVPLLDDYLEFVAARCRPNTLLAVAFDLKVFFGLVGKPPAEVTSSDVLAFISAQRAGGDGRSVRPIDEEMGLSARTVARRLSTVSGLFAYLLARGEVTRNPVPRGLPTRRETHRPQQGVPLVRRPRTLPRILSPAEVDALLGALRTRRESALSRFQRAPLGGDLVAGGHPGMTTAPTDAVTPRRPWRLLIVFRGCGAVVLSFAAHRPDPGLGGGWGGCRVGRLPDDRSNAQVSAGPAVLEGCRMFTG